MKRWIASSLVIGVTISGLTHCGKKSPTERDISASPADTRPTTSEAANATNLNDKLPAKGAAADAPEFVRALSLLYPQAEIYRVDGRIVQKSNHNLRDLVSYYEGAFFKHGFAQTARLEQTGSALLQYERTVKDVKELISVDIAKLPYADNYLIRIGRSDVDYSRGQKE